MKIIKDKEILNNYSKFKKPEETQREILPWSWFGSWTSKGREDARKVGETNIK